MNSQRNNIGNRGTSAALAIVLCAFGSPGSAVSSGGSKIDAELTRNEQVVFGKISPQLPRQQRLVTLEKAVSGECKDRNAPFEKRLQHINAALGFSHKTTKQVPAHAELPPLAPDRHLATNASASQPPRALSEAMSGLNNKQLLQLGVRKVAEGDKFNAEFIFRRVVGTDPTNADALFDLGALSEQRNDLVSALGFYQSALKSRPNDKDLQQAVASIQGQFTRTNQKSNPLIGGTQFSQNQHMQSPQFLAQQAQFAQQQPYIGSVYNNARLTNYPIISVQNPAPQAIQVRQPKPEHGLRNQVTNYTVHTGLAQFGLARVACPICDMLNRL